MNTLARNLQTSLVWVPKKRGLRHPVQVQQHRPEIFLILCVVFLKDFLFFFSLLFSAAPSPVLTAASGQSVCFEEGSRDAQPSCRKQQVILCFWFLF